MFNRTALLISAATFICVACCQNTVPVTEPAELGNTEGKVVKASEDVKADFPDAEWLETKQDQVRFMFCANDLPSYGESRIEIRGWVYRSYSERWESVLVVQLTGVGKVTLSVDPNTRLFSAKGSANNKFLNESLCTFDLSATG
jgi:hypothetical protein